MGLKDVKGIGVTYEKKLHKAGVTDVDTLVLASIEELGEKTGISTQRLKQWQKDARKKVIYKQTEVREDLSKSSSVRIADGKAMVFIRDVCHENVPVFQGMFDAVKNEMEKIPLAVYFGKKEKVIMWFHKQWHYDIPVTETKTVAQPAHAQIEQKKELKKGFFSKLRKWWIK